MDDRNHKARISIPIDFGDDTPSAQDPDDVFEIDGDAVDLDYEALVAEPERLEDSLEQLEHEPTDPASEDGIEIEVVAGEPAARGDEPDGTLGDGTESPDDAPSAGMVAEAEAASDPEIESYLETGPATETVADYDSVGSADGQLAQEDDEPVVEWIDEDDELAAFEEIDPDVETDPVAETNGKPTPGVISREAVYEMMLELRQRSEEVERLALEKNDLFDRLLRKQAEFENFRKRGEREMQEAYVRARADLLADLLPILDNFELALQHADTSTAESLREGIALIFKQFSDTLRRVGLEPIDAEGTQFDPEIHEAVATQPSDEVESNTVLDVMQRGYKAGDRLLRPARVRVAVEP